jgi:flagellar biosynthesis chaperone FliJ
MNAYQQILKSIKSLIDGRIKIDEQFPDNLKAQISAQELKSLKKSIEELELIWEI